MYSDNKQIRDVADVAARIMYGQQPVTEKLHPNQQQLDVHEPEKDELTADDFKKLRGKKEVKKEEVVDESMLNQLRDRGNVATGQKQQDRKNFDTNTGAALKPNSAISGIRARMQNKVQEEMEEVEQQDEATEKKTDFMDRQKRLSAAAAETAKDPERLKRMMKIPGYAAAMGLAKKTTTKEEVETLDELSKSTLGSYAKKATRDATITRKIGADFEHQGNRAKSPGMKAASNEMSQKYKEKSWKRRDGVDKAVDRLTKEETILEYETDKNGKFVHNAKAGRYGGSEKPQDPFAAVRGPGQKDLAKIEAEKKKKKKFSEMVGLYNEKGLKSLSEMLVKEEPDNEQFTKELEDAKAKSEGKKRNTEIAKGQPIAPIPVKEGWKGAVIGGALGSLAGPAGALAGAAAGHFVGNDMAKSGKDKKVAQTAQAQQQAKQGVKKEDFEERHMSDDEMDKRETIVKGMKKGLAGFKDRYGSRANDVMYATATKQAMK